MRFIIISLLFLVFATGVQAEWKWAIWEKQTSIFNGQVEKVTAWKAVGIFEEKKVCQEYTNAMLFYIADDWSIGKREGDEIIYKVALDPSSDDFWQRYAVIKKTVRETGEDLFSIDLVCQPKTTPQSFQQKKKVGNK